MTADIPFIGIGPMNFQGLSLTVRSLKIIYIFCKLVQSIASRRGTAHTHGKYTGFQLRKGGGDFSLVVNGIFKGDGVTVGLSLQVYA
jgi:hypothetical protein